jgi:hypothetical protein
MTRFGQLVRKYRGRRTLREAGLVCGVDFGLFGQIESGRVRMPRRETREKIITGLDIPRDQVAEAIAADMVDEDPGTSPAVPPTEEKVASR